MLILSRVCAEFRDKSGQVLLTVTPDRLLSFIEAPEAVREDPLFSLLLSDGSLEAVRSVDQRKALEADPDEGMTAEGRKASAVDDDGANAESRKASAVDADGTDAEGRKALTTEKPAKGRRKAAPAEPSEAEDAQKAASGADA